MVPSVIAYIHTQYTLGFSKHYKHKTNLAHLSRVPYIQNEEMTLENSPPVEI